MNLDHDVRTVLRARAEGVTAAPMIPPGTVRRVRLRKTLMTGSAAVVIVGLVFGGFAASRSLSNDAVPIPPSDESENQDQSAVSYSFADVEVSLHAPEPWAEMSAQKYQEHFGAAQTKFPEAWAGSPAGLAFDQNIEERLGLDADPHPVGDGCQGSVAWDSFGSGDAKAMAREIRSDPELEATAPVAVSVGGVNALRMDVTAVPGASLCSKWGEYPAAPMVLAGGGSEGAALEEGSRMRLYLLDTPWRGENWSRRVFALWIVAPKARFEHVAEAAQPILESIEFHAP